MDLAMIDVRIESAGWGNLYLSCTACSWVEPQDPGGPTLATLVRRAAQHWHCPDPWQPQHAGESRPDACATCATAARPPTRRHPTCIDVSTIDQGRGTAYVCGPECPPTGSQSSPGSSPQRDIPPSGQGSRRPAGQGGDE